MLELYDRDDLTKFTDYRGYDVNDDVIQWFWECVRSWPPSRRSRLLQFATGTSKNFQGSDGPRQFIIKKAGKLNQAPKIYTSLNRIDIPPYKDYVTLELKLTNAIECVSLSWEYLPLINVAIVRRSGLRRARNKRMTLPLRCRSVVFYHSDSFHFVLSDQQDTRLDLSLPLLICYR